MDEARKVTDETLEKMIKHLSTIYNNAYHDISDKWNKYMKSHSKKVEDVLIELQNAKKSGDPTRVKDAQDHYARTVKNVTVNDERFQAMRDEVLEKITRINEVAVDYINGNMAHIYTMNYNAFGTEKIAGYSFALVNEEAIKELATTDNLLLPKRKVDVPKDKAWNKKNINSQILQGILQGENIPKMAQRLRNVTDMNHVSAVRTARTMTTAAENKGRQDSFKKATDDGVIMEREWLAAHDSHTRAWHLDLHGKRVGVDEPWENDFGKIMYPGDPTADPANVYNCRCAIRAHVKGFAWNQKKEAAEFSEENIVAGVDIDTPQYDVFSEEFRDVIPQLANDVENSKIPSAKELNALYRNAKTPQDEELVEFVGDLASNVLSYRNESEEMQKYHAEIFSVLSKPHDGSLFRGESGEWVKHYGDFTVGKEISFEHLSFTTPNIEGTPSHHTGVIFEFASGTKSINFVGQDNVENDELILGNFIVQKVEDFNGVPRVLLKHKGKK